jgi:hypothetical protein
MLNQDLDRFNSSTKYDINFSNRNGVLGWGQRRARSSQGLPQSLGTRKVYSYFYSLIILIEKAIL